MCCLLDGDDRDQVHFRLSGETSLSTTHHQNLKVCKSENRAYRWLSIIQNIVMNLLSFCLWGWSVHETLKNECVCASEHCYLAAIYHQGFARITQATRQLTLPVQIRPGNNFPSQDRTQRHLYRVLPNVLMWRRKINHGRHPTGMLVLPGTRHQAGRI